jgi:hypothetical protein
MIMMPTPYTTAISSTSASTELRSLNADAMVASNRGIAYSGINLRSRNCCSRGRMRRWTTSSAIINRGKATKKRMWTSTSSRNGTVALPRNI